MAAQPVCDNIALDFDGVDDHVTTPNPLIGSLMNNFTVAAWFRDDRPAGVNDGFLYRLFAWTSTNRIELGDTNGNLTLFTNPTGSLTGPPIRDGLWHHVALVRTPTNITVFMDGNLAIGPVTLSAPFTNLGSVFRIGDWVGTGGAPRFWRGRVDEFKIWGLSLTQSQIQAEMECGSDPYNNDLLIYFPFDQNIPNGNNAGMITVNDEGPGGGITNGILSGFALNGSTSNWVDRGLDLLPLCVELVVRDLVGNIVHEACAVSPLNFALLNMPPGVTPVWQCLEGGVWQDLPSATGLAFTAIPTTLFGLDCGGCTGSWDKQVRAKFVIPSGGSGPACERFSEVYPLRLCCPLSKAASVTVTPNMLLCEGQMVTFDVSLTSPDCFVQSPSGDVQIQWSLVGQTGNIVGTDNQTSFSYPDLILGPTDVCFQAVITNCAGKQITVAGCVPVDPMPVCGIVVGISPTLTEVFIDPVTGNPLPTGDKAYTICPGKDAVLEAVGFDFNTCIPRWEYSDDNGDTWQPIGSSTNTIQNTNTLFPPPAGACRYYRVVCLPLSNPSGCVPCISNVVRICQKPAPISALINGCDMEVCKDDPIALSISGPEPGVSYTWLCNGLEVGAGPNLNLTAEKSACYWVEAANGCTVVESAKCCVNVCAVVAVISCPQPPNECACFGDPITLTGAGSFTTCPPGNLTYQWSWLDANGDPQTSNDIVITNTPPLAGTTYMLTVTDLNTGCSNTSHLFIKPCVKF